MQIQLTVSVFKLQFQSTEGNFWDLLARWQTKCFIYLRFFLVFVSFSKKRFIFTTMLRKDSSFNKLYFFISSFFLKIKRNIMLVPSKSISSLDDTFINVYNSFANIIARL